MNPDSILSTRRAIRAALDGWRGGRRQNGCCWHKLAVWG